MASEEAGFSTQDKAIDRLTTVYQEKKAAPRNQGKAERIQKYGAVRFREYTAEWKARRRDLAESSLHTLESLLEHHILPTLGSRRMSTFDHNVARTSPGDSEAPSPCRCRAGPNTLLSTGPPTRRRWPTLTRSTSRKACWGLCATADTHSTDRSRHGSVRSSPPNSPTGRSNRSVCLSPKPLPPVVSCRQVRRTAGSTWSCRPCGAAARAGPGAATGPRGSRRADP